LQRVWLPARWSAERSLRPIMGTAPIIQGRITRARRLRITANRRRHLSLAILHRHLAMPRPAILRRGLTMQRRHLDTLRLAIHRRRRATPCRPALPLETQWPTACSVTGHTTRKPEPISEPTANVITALEPSLWENIGERRSLLCERGMGEAASPRGGRVCAEAGSRNGSNPDLSVVVLNRLTLRYGLVLRRSQNTTLLPTALLGHAGRNVLHTGVSFLFSQSTEAPYVVGMLKMGDNSCIGVTIYCRSYGTSDMVNPRLHLRLAQDRCELRESGPITPITPVLW
jgi:hypothetical protein